MKEFVMDHGVQIAFLAVGFIYELHLGETSAALWVVVCFVLYAQCIADVVIKAQRDLIVIMERKQP